MEMDKVQLVKEATERVAKARAEVIQTSTFYGVLVSNVDPVASFNFPTMATNGKQHYFNPQFIETLSQEEVVGTVKHETEHDARRHHTRRGWRDPVEWNICTDFAINIDLVDSGVKLPKGALIDPKYRGMSAEDIYRSREIDRELAKQQEQPEPEEGDDEGDDAEKETGDDENEADTDEGKGDDSDDGEGTEGAGDDTDEADGGKGKGEGDDEGEGTGEGSGGADDEADGEPGEGQQSSGDPGGCGEVLDASDTPGELSNEDAKWETIVRQASMLAAKRGDAPGHVSRLIETADHPPQDWRETLRAFFDGGATAKETWSKPNRRFIGGGLYMPGRIRDGMNKVVFMIDTSGSVVHYPGALEAIKIETQAALDEGVIDEAVILYGDTQVTRVDEYRGGDEIEFDPKGGGGTVMKPLFNYVATEVSDASLIVAFTDLEIEPEAELGPEPHCPVLWAVVGYPQNVKRYLAATPWNAQGIEVRPE